MLFVLFIYDGKVLLWNRFMALALGLAVQIMKFFNVVQVVIEVKVGHIRLLRTFQLSLLWHE